ncbi:alpha/beta hydrolase [Herbiconiux liangxiaofengii]|uniref:alpha/beta hydrolase n=1 Tax=Herbiconiux liangxiaofengii TaxID=3342795 RepID=UPI0035B6D200
MTAGLYGADVAQLREFARLAATAASEARSAASVVATQVQSSPWRGPDAQQFRAEWSSQHGPRLHAIGGALDEVARVIRGNADAQETTSTDDAGATGGPGAGFPASTASTTPAAPAAGTPDPPANGSPDDVTAWWNGLTDAQRAALIEQQPELVGALDGVPGAARDEANRILLQQEIERVEAMPGLPDRNAAAERARLLDALNAIDKALDDKPGTQLLLLDTQSGDQVHAALAVGDVDTAENVAVFTQGMNSGTEVENGVSNSVNDAARLQQASDAQLRQDGEAGSTAVVVWMGYDAPGIGQVANPIYGANGAPDLAQFAEGLRSVNGDAHLTALGHSYGSYVTGSALRLTDAFDDAVVFGSPGVTTGDVDNLEIGSGTLYVIEADGDAVADFGYFGPDPNHITGATNLSSDAEGSHLASSGHSEYLIDKSTSLYNIGAVVSGNADRAIEGDNSGLGDILRGSLGLSVDLPTSIIGKVLGVE